VREPSPRVNRNESQGPVSSDASNATEPPIYSDSEAACYGSGGKYIGDMKCQSADGSVTQILSGADAARARMTSIPVPARTPHSWVLATTAITFEYDGYRHDLLAGEAATPESIAKGKDLLSRWWSISSRDDLLHMLNWLQFEGHRKQFEELGRRVTAMTDAQFTRAIGELQTSADQLHQVQIVRQYYPALGSKSILAWDLIRYVSLCRWGYLVGYISETEAWNRMMPAALRLQETFDSWQDAQSDFLIGREFWSKGQSMQSDSSFREIYERLSRESASPWNTNPWDMDLHVATPLSIANGAAE
jgi:hypothetical protein